MSNLHNLGSGSIEIPGREGEYLDPRTLSTTPGGTIYGTTPGGTKIVYNREALLFLQNSPLSRTPPSNLPRIPGVTAPSDEEEEAPDADLAAPAEEEAPPATSEEGSDGMFAMD